MISLIVPVLNEEKAIEALLAHLETLSGEKEIIVVDGGSADRTIEMIELAAERVSVAAVIEGPRGRGPQCDAGAARASGDTLLFVHADSRLEQDALARVERAVARGAAWGCFRLRFDDAHWAARAVAWASNLRARWRGVVFGDQGIFMTRELFGEVGGFPALPLMEDYQLSLNLKKRKLPPAQINCFITSSARRLVAGGRLRTAWKMWRLRALYRRGADISIIQAMYRDVR